MRYCYKTVGRIYHRALGHHSRASVKLQRASGKTHRTSLALFHLSQMTIWIIFLLSPVLMVQELAWSDGTTLIWSLNQWPISDTIPASHPLLCDYLWSLSVTSWFRSCCKSSKLANYNFKIKDSKHLLWSERKGVGQCKGDKRSTILCTDMKLDLKPCYKPRSLFCAMVSFPHT